MALLVMAVCQLPRLVLAMPVFRASLALVEKHPVLTAQQFYVNLIVSICLVLAGGCFAGLTLGLMGQDEVYLKVIATSGEPLERKHAKRVLKLIGRGKHWVLVTLLLLNVITNETLPIVLDRCLGGGWPAVVTSTVAIVIFGEVIPQSVSVRYGLQVGSVFSPFVLFLMYLMYPVAYPCALLLDYILGEDHGTVYKKLGLKTLVTLHKTMGVERLNQDEVTIISAVLDLKEKPVSHIMTPVDRVYTMSADTILDEQTVEEIFNAGFSRIPIHLPNEPMNFIGMLLVRVLISYDPEDALPVATFPLATLPETGADTSCLNILNYFQEGKSHMIVVSETPGEPTGAMGVLTLEDVIEELIGEEIVDESDVYIDINKNIKRTHPGPLSKRNLTSYLHNLYQRSASTSKRNSLDGLQIPAKEPILPAVLKTPASPAVESFEPVVSSPLAHNDSSPLADAAQVVEGTKNWLPKNPANNPLETNKSFVTIKRPNIDSVKSNLSPQKAPKSPNAYGAIHPTEEGAIRDARLRLSFENTRVNTDEVAANRRKLTLSENQRFLLPDESDLSEARNGNGKSQKDFHYNDYLSGGDPVPILDYRESRSYRTGGIVESVVNVLGVHKTIIEHVSDDEEHGVHITPSKKSRRANGLEQFEIDNEDNDEVHGLLSGMKKKNGSSPSNAPSSSSVHSDDSKGKSIWKKLVE